MSTRTGGVAAPTTLRTHASENTFKCCHVVVVDWMPYKEKLISKDKTETPCEAPEEEIICNSKLMAVRIMPERRRRRRSHLTLSHFYDAHSFLHRVFFYYYYSLGDFLALSR